LIRNLIFHLFPIEGPIWSWHVEQLIRYKSVWNGKRVVVLALGAGTADETAVRRALGPLDAEILVRQNQSYRGEAAHFVEAISLLESVRPDETTFYAHAKGVSRTEREHWIRRWCDAMYRLNLGNVTAVDRHLLTKKAVGAFRLIKNHSGSPWHYSGTFWWIRHDALFAPGWDDVPGERYAVEGYPGRRVALEDSVSLTEDNVPAELLYNGWVDEPRIQAWEKALA